VGVHCKTLVLLIGVILRIVLFTLYVHTGLFLLCGGVFCTAVYCHCLSDPSLLEKVSGVPELEWVIVLILAGRGTGRGWVVGLILWLFLEFLGSLRKTTRRVI